MDEHIGTEIPGRRDNGLHVEARSADNGYVEEMLVEALGYGCTGYIALAGEMGAARIPSDETIDVQFFRDSMEALVGYG